MSTIAQDLEAAQKKIEDISSLLAASEAGRDTAMAKVAELSDLSAKATEAHAAEVVNLNAKISDEVSAHAKTSESLKDVTGRLENAERTLADPSFRAAATKGDDNGVPDGGQAKETASRDQLEAEYAKIPSGTVAGAQARAEFRAKYKVELGL